MVRFRADAEDDQRETGGGLGGYVQRATRGGEKRMGIRTEIPYCDSTVNELVGCDGCCLHQKGKPESHCYAAGLVRRYAGLPGWPPSFDTPTLIPGRLAQAIKWPDLTGKDRPEKPWLNGYPRIIFVSDLSDPFTESVDPDSWLTPALPAMADSPHIYILLTKRGRRMLEYWQRYPIPRNVWPGVTVTGPETVKRVECLVEIPGAAVRFVSAEPLLGSVNLHPYMERLDWVIVGAESGPCPRPMDLAWPRSLCAQCQYDGVPFFFKQMCDERGRKLPGRLLDGATWSGMPRWAA